MHGDNKGAARNCPANGFTLGIAWAVFEDSTLHNSIQDTLGCSSEVWADGNSWFSWLAMKDEGTSAYNLHRLTQQFLVKVGMDM